MKFFNSKEVKGAVAILLVMILLPMMVLSALMVDTARYQLSKSMVSGAGDLAMNAAMADYDTILKDVYGLFAVSQADKVEENVKRYFEETLLSYGVVSGEDAEDYVSSLLGAAYEYLVLGDKDAANFMSLKVADDMKVTLPEDSSLARPEVLEKQIVEYMKYRAPVNLGLSFLDSLSAFTKIEEQTEVVEAQVKAQEKMEPVAEANQGLYNNIRAYDDKYNELEPETVPEDGFHLKNYGTILKSYRERYAEVNRLTLVFASASYGGKWEISSAELKPLNEAGDFIVEEGGSLRLSGRLPESTVTYANLAEARAGAVSLYGEVSSGSFKGTVSLYGGRSFQDGLLSGVSFAGDDARENAIRQFQEIDSFYKSNYPAFYEACVKLDKYDRAVESFQAKAAEQIAKLEGEVRELVAAMEAADRRKAEAAEALDTAKRDSEEASRDAGEAAAAAEAALKTAEEAERKAEGGTGDKAAEEAERARDEADAAAEEADRAGKKAEDCARAVTETEESTARITAESDREKGIAEADKGLKEREIASLNSEKETMAAQLQEILRENAASMNAYNADNRIYRGCKSAAKNTVSMEAGDMAAQFTLIRGNMAELARLLEDIITALEASSAKISDYDSSVGAWENKNNTYSSKGEDNFSMGNDADIQEAHDNFNMDEVNELLTCVRAEADRLKTALEQIDSNFYYMGVKQIKDITDADQVAAVIRDSSYYGRIQPFQTEGAIPPEQCKGTDYFGYTDDIDVNFLEELKRLAQPYPCCVFMNYLYQTYQLDGERLEENVEEGNKAKTQSSNYNDIKKGNVASAITDGEKGDRSYGYSYKSMSSISGEDLPSSGEMVTKVSEKNTNANSSAGLSANKALASQMLGGLTNAMETGRDKLFVMSYLFDHFSYNTMVQDMAREDGKDVKWLCPAEWYSPYMGKAKTLGDVPINAANNRLYGAEIEYVLYGDRNPSANVTYAKASIFAVRFLFNTVFAFTDSGIRNDTRAVGMAVQAASLGVIPYQLVQVVMQLALAMGESAVDLANMEAGAKVVLVKSADTWLLSSSGFAREGMSRIKDMAKEGISMAADHLTGKINELVDAGVEELSAKVSDIQEDLGGCVKNAAGEVLDMAVARTETIIDQELQKAAFYKEEALGDSLEAARGHITASVDAAFHSAQSRLTEAFSTSGTEGIQKLVYEQMQACVTDILATLKEDIHGKINAAADVESLRKIVYEAVYKVKGTVSNELNGKIDSVLASVSNGMKGKVSEAAVSIKDSAAKATEEGRDQAVKAMNGFLDDISGKSTKMNTAGALADVNQNAVKDSVKASAVTFGYSDYLRLFVFIGLCADDRSGALLKRTGDLIQLNITGAKGDSQLVHRKGADFRLKNARTYVSLNADVELELMFLNFGIFQRQVEEYNKELDEGSRMDLGSAFTIHYIGLSGY